MPEKDGVKRAKREKGRKKTATTPIDGYEMLLDSGPVISASVSTLLRALSFLFFLFLSRYHPVAVANTSKRTPHPHPSLHITVTLCHGWCRPCRSQTQRQSHSEVHHSASHCSSLSGKIISLILALPVLSYLFKSEFTLSPNSGAMPGLCAWLWLLNNPMIKRKGSTKEIGKKLHRCERYTAAAQLDGADANLSLRSLHHLKLYSKLLSFIYPILFFCLCKNPVVDICGGLGDCFQLLTFFLFHLKPSFAP